jgi:hypothetical protein
MQTGCHLIVIVLSDFCNGRRQRYWHLWKRTQGNTLGELIREREREYWLWLGGVNGEFKIVITRASILSSDYTAANGIYQPNGGICDQLLGQANQDHVCGQTYHSATACW